jgi:preprotein translocase subunit SecE
MAERNRPGDAGEPADDEVFDDAVAEDAESEEDLEAEPVGRGGTALVERTKDETPKKKKEARRAGFFGRIGGFFREVVSELRKVIWPTRKELLTYTTIVIGFVTVMTAIVALLDYGFGKAILWAFGG